MSERKLLSKRHDRLKQLKVALVGLRHKLTPLRVVGPLEGSPRHDEDRQTVHQRWEISV